MFPIGPLTVAIQEKLFEQRVLSDSDFHVDPPNPTEGTNPNPLVISAQVLPQQNLCGDEVTCGSLLYLGEID